MAERRRVDYEQVESDYMEKRQLEAAPQAGCCSPGWASPT